MTSQQDTELETIITKLRAGKDPDTGKLHITEEEAIQAIKKLFNTPHINHKEED